MTQFFGYQTEKHAKAALGEPYVSAIKNTRPSYREMRVANRDRGRPIGEVGGQFFYADHDGPDDGKLAMMVVYHYNGHTFSWEKGQVAEPVNA